MNIMNQIISDLDDQGDEMKDFFEGYNKDKNVNIPKTISTLATTL